MINTQQPPSSDTTPTLSPYTYDKKVTTYIPNVINKDVFEDKGYVEFYNNCLKRTPETLSDIHMSIKNILKQKFSGYTTEDISFQLQQNPVYINQILSIWNTYYTTYFKKYGRVMFNNNNQQWIFIPNWHPQSRNANISFDELQFYHPR